MLGQELQCAGDDFLKFPFFALLIPSVQPDLTLQTAHVVLPILCDMVQPHSPCFCCYRPLFPLFLLFMVLFLTSRMGLCCSCSLLYHSFYVSHAQCGSYYKVYYVLTPNQEGLNRIVRGQFQVIYASLCVGIYIQCCLLFVCSLLEKGGYTPERVSSGRQVLSPALPYLFRTVPFPFLIFFWEIGNHPLTQFF